MGTTRLGQPWFQVLAWLTLLGLAGCSSGVAEEEVAPPEVSRVESPSVVLGGGETAFISHVHRLTRGQEDRLEWVVDEQEPASARLRQRDGPFDRGQPGQELDRALIAADGAGRLWTAVHAEGRLNLCLRRPTLEEDCFSPLVSFDGSPRALAANGEGQALVLTWGRHGAAPDGAPHWRGVKLTDGGPSEFYDLSRLLAEGDEPALLYGPLGAFVVSHRGTALAVARLTSPQDRYDLEWSTTLPAGAATWAAALEDAGAGRIWLVRCVEPDRVAVRRRDADGWHDLPPPPSPAAPCSAGAGGLRLVVSAQGDALVVWSLPGPDGQPRWYSQRWRDADSAWEPAASMASTPGLGEPRLAADRGGRFVAARARVQGEDRIVVAEIQGDDGHWQYPVDLGKVAYGGAFGGPVVAAGGDGRAVLAWAEPLPGQPEPDGRDGSRLATARLDMRVRHAWLDVQALGEGSVASRPARIGCPGACTAQFPEGSTVQLRAVAAAGHRLQGWSGGAEGCSGNFETVDLAITGPASCSAVFVPLDLPALTLAVQGLGSVGADPPGPTYARGTPVTLTATPAGGQRFAGWSGDVDCSDGRLTMDAARACTANFEADPGQVRLLLSVSGGGRVQSSPAGLDCPGSCQAWFALGQSVVLTAQPPAGHTVAWGPGCAGNGATATLVLDAAASCTVGFVAPPPTGWLELGAAPPPAGGLVGRPAIAADAQGVPTIAYTTEIAELRELYVMRLVGDAWRVVGNGPINDPLVSALQPSLALDANGHPVVAFGTSRGRVQVRRWDGAQWLHLADDLSLAPGAVTSGPQLAVFGDQVVVAFVESTQSARIAVMRSPLAGGAWTGALVDGVSFTSGGELRLALDGAGRASVAYVTNAGVSGERAPRVMHESATGWVPLCGGDVGGASGTGYANAGVGYGLQHAADGSALLVRPRDDFLGVQAWRCDGAAWQPWGADDGRLATVDNTTVYLKTMAMAAAGPPTLAVQLSTGYAGGARVLAYTAGPGGFTAVGPALELTLPGLFGALAVAPAAAGSPAVAVGLESAGRGQLHTARFHP